MARDVEAGRAFVRVSIREDLKGLKNISNKLKSWGANISMIGAGITGLGASVLTPLAGMVKMFSDAGSSLNDMSGRTGVAVETLSSLGYAATMTGASMEDVEKALRKMQQNGFQADQLGAIANELAAMSDPAARTARAMQIFGRSGTMLLPMLSGGAAGLAEFRAQAERLGVVMSTADATAADELGDRMDEVKLSLKGVAMQIGAALAPSITELAAKLSGLVSRVIAFVKANRPMVVSIAKTAAIIAGVGLAVTALGAIVAAAGLAVGGLVTIIGAIGSVLGVVLSPIGLLVGVVAAGTAAFLTFTETGQWLAATLMADFGTAFDTVKSTISGIANALKAGEFKLAGEIAMTGLKLAFFEATNSLRKKWIEFNIGVVKDLKSAATGILEVWRNMSQRIATWMADRLYELSLLISGQRDLLTEEERESARDSSLNEAYNRIQNALQRSIDELASATEQGLNESLSAGEERLRRLREELAKLTGIAADRVANLPQTKPAPKPHEVQAAVRTAATSASGLLGTFSAAAARIAFRGVGTDYAKDTAENTRQSAKSLKKIEQQQADTGAVFV